MRIEYPTDGQLPQLRALWQLAFGDSEEFLDKFYASAYAPRRCRCVVENGRVAAALYWFDAEYEGQKFAYLYAVATHPDFRRRGLCRALMADTHALLAERGYDGALLMPEGPALRQMYAGMGYRDCCTVSEFSCTAGSLPADLRAIGPEEYARLRRKLLPGDGVIQEGENLACLAAFAGLYAGEDFLLAAAARGDSLQGIEFLGSREAAPGILRALEYAHGSFRTPGKDIPFAMFRPLREDAHAPGYFGLAFD